MLRRRIWWTLALICAHAWPSFAWQAKRTSPSYHIYAGSSHAHSAFTWSHGDMLAKTGCAGVEIYGLTPGNEVLFDWTKNPAQNPKGCYAMFVINGFQYHTPEMPLRPDWQAFQGPPADHYAKAKAAGFDWYAVTDHSQEAAFFPLGPNNKQWLASKREAAAATDSGFVALAGFEFSENDGPGGTGHINVINSDDIVNALQPGVDLSYFYRWLATAKPNGQGPIVASFNHPGPHSYTDFTGRTPAATEIISLFEVLNSNWHVHYDGYIAALDAGWKVSPTSGLDNHGTRGISTLKSRVFVLAETKSKVAILNAMRQRRTYASLDNNIQCRYTVNGAMMGSTLSRPGVFRFHIDIKDPDTNDARAKITKLDIVTDGGKVVKTYEPSQPSTEITWSPEIHDGAAHYFFVRVWSAGGGDSPKPDPSLPVAWLAPVWTGIAAPMTPMLPPTTTKAGSAEK